MASIVMEFIAIIGFAITFAKYDSIVMYAGIKMLRMIRIGFGAGMGLFGITTAVGFINNVRYENEQLRLEAERQLAIEEHTEYEIKRNAMLSVENHKLDPEFVSRCLAEQGDIKWQKFYKTIRLCVKQFEQMDDYQARFSKLLTSNGANALNDTEDVIDQVEQYMCKNARTVINFMMVADYDAEGDVEQKLDMCYQENEKLLAQTKDFIYAMTEVLNSQGGQSDTRLMETYKETLLSTIHKESML